jgi:hypothetical protein
VLTAGQAPTVIPGCRGTSQSSSFRVERTLSDLPASQFVPGWEDAPAVHPEVHPMPDGLPCLVRVDGTAVGVFTGVSGGAT